LSSTGTIIPLTIAASLVSLFILGAVSAAAGGAQVILAALRVTVWSALAMGVTAGVGALVGAVTNG
jgi:VIT1/CCC1 family predicted Fe2+/Mn2+ transporter